MSEDVKIMEHEPLVRDRYIPEKLQFLGKRGISRMDGQEKAGGTAQYTRDVNLPGMLFCKILASPYANALIKSVDTTKAEALPGVRAILRFDDPELEGKVLLGTNTKFNAGHQASDGQAFTQS